MKYKLTDISFDNLQYSPKDLLTGTLINVKYSGETLEFQTPKVFIQDIIREAGKEYLLLQIKSNQACKKFFEKILELENNFVCKFNATLIKSTVEDDHFIVKVPFVYSKPDITVFSDNGNLFNYYHLSKGMEIICLLFCDKLWMNKDNSFQYYLQVKEIMLLKK
jgi:hypothetical protein